MHLLDVYVWLALAFQRHLHHQRATDWFTAAREDSCFFCRFTQLSFLRLATTPQVMMDQALTLVEAWQAYDDLYQDPRVVLAEEPARIETIWRTLTQAKTFSPKVWNDAYLAVFAQAADLELITLDQGFSQYPDLHLTVLS